MRDIELIIRNRMNEICNSVVNEIFKLLFIIELHAIFWCDNQRCVCASLMVAREKLAFRSRDAIRDRNVIEGREARV